MKIRLLLISLYIILAASQTFAQQIYDIRSCISTGLEKNYSLMITKNSEIISRNNYTPGNAGYLPSLNLSGRHSGTLNDIRTNVGDTNSTFSGNIHNTTNAASLNLGLTIFEGFSVTTTYRKLGELKNLGELNTQFAIENLVSDIVAAYYNYIQQVKLLENLRYAVSLSKERLRIDEDRYLLGSSSKLQVLQSRVYLNADSSRLSKQCETVHAAQVRLNELLAVEDLNGQFVTRDTTIEVNQELLYEKLLTETLENNTSLQIARSNMNVSEFDYRLAKSRSYPYLTASSGYNYNFNTYSSGSSSNQQTNGLSYGLTLGFNLFDGMNQRRTIRNSSISLQNTELRYQELEQGVRADLITIYSAYSNFLRLIELEKQNLQTATENLSIAMERYKLGSLSGIDLREVQKSLLDARESLLSVEYQTKLAEISLNLISGHIMNYYN
ncbi:MAG TPA: TolC family protein [Bacteroidales bacterium]|nr:TolC family protein [Bacteroidales bacterium]HPF03782.1 TolC family protein [Bacteroidales bacterium]HPJ58591.1 TolC family protein [Bacteroidales bacterium]HPR11250.1 TolC family protein [Bacteroidales bacterium]HRW86522.1 TolC family protein [Bacteroidales bacterium]